MRSRLHSKIGLLTKLIAIGLVFVYTNIAVACEQTDVDTSKIVISQSHTIEQTAELNSQNNHADCIGECCETACDCTMGSSASLLITFAPDQALLFSVLERYIPHQVFYNFNLPPILNRPPITNT